jgi:PAS domain S-box-containing protein
MSPLAAGLVFLLCGALLLVTANGETLALRRLACGMAGVGALLNVGFIAGHVHGDALAFERWLTQSRPEMQLTSLLTDIALLSAALSLLFRWLVPSPSWAVRQVAALMALVPQLIGLVVLVSYAAGAPLLYGTGHIPMASPSALCCLVLGLALNFSAGCDTWPMAVFGTGSGRTREWSILGVSAGVLTVFLLLGTLILLGGSLLLRGQIRTAQRRVDAELESIAELKARQISAWYLERGSDAELMSRSELIQAQVRRFLVGGPQAPSEGDVRAWMGELHKEAYRRLVLFDGQGRVRVSVPDEQPSVMDALEASELQKALCAKGVMIEDLHEDSAYSGVHMSFWVPIRVGSADAKPVGAMLLVLDPRQFLYPFIQSWPTASVSSETLLVRRDGDDVLFLNDLRHRAGTAMKLRFPLAANPAMPAVRAILGQVGLYEGTDYRGVPVLSVVQPIPGTPWHMVTKVDEAEVYGPLRQRVWVGGPGLMGILGLVGAGLGVLLRRHDAEMVRKQLSLAQRFELIMREANDIIFLTDDMGEILEANQRAVECYGYKQAEFLGMNIMDLRDSVLRTEGQELFDLTKNQRSLRFDSVHRRKDGGAISVEVSARTLSLDDEMRVIVFVRDITERQTQQAELVRMTQLYSALSQVNQAIVWAPTREALLDKICEVMVEFGCFDLAWIGLNEPQTQRVVVAAKYGDTKGYLDRIQVESLPSRLGAGPVGTAIREGRPFIENDFLGSVETEPWHEAATESGLRAMAAFPIRQAGLVIGALAVYSKEKNFFGAPEAALLEEAAVDVSFAVDHLAGEDQRRNTELALLESERLLTEAQEAGGVGTYTWYIREDHWRSSAFLDQIFGITPDYPRNLAGWSGLVTPDFQATMQAYVIGIIERHERFNLDYPIIRVSDGALRWVHGQGDIQRDAEDQPLAMVGVIQDITERKLAEGTLRRISVAVEQSPLSIVITNPEAIIEYVNPAFTRVTGYTSEEALGQNPRILKSTKTQSGVYQKMWETLTKGEVWVGEFENLRKNGELFHERATITPVHDEAGVLVNYIAFKEDITQAKQDEVERHSLESQLHQ